MPDLNQYALAEVEPGRVALCRIYGKPVQATDWKGARAQIPEGALDKRTGYGAVPPVEPSQNA